MRCDAFMCLAMLSWLFNWVEGCEAGAATCFVRISRHATGFHAPTCPCPRPPLQSCPCTSPHRRVARADLVLPRVCLCTKTRRIVNKEWEYSHKRGFKCTYERGILHVYFNFVRTRYRR